MLDFKEEEFENDLIMNDEQMTKMIDMFSQMTQIQHQKQAQLPPLKGGGLPAIAENPRMLNNQHLNSKDISDIIRPKNSNGFNSGGGGLNFYPNNSNNRPPSSHSSAITEIDLNSEKGGASSRGGDLNPKLNNLMNSS